ncbi:hypothetical protein ACFV3P_24815 [Streptomyces albidoflavus]
MQALTLRQGVQMKGGVQLPMFTVEAGPATVAGPARPVAADSSEAHEPEPLTAPWSPIGDHPAAPEVDR